MRFWGNFVEKGNPSIEYLELYAIAVVIVFWADLLQNRRVVIFCNNESVVKMVNRSSARCPNSMTLIRIITIISLHSNVRFFVRHIRENCIPLLIY